MVSVVWDLEARRTIDPLVAAFWRYPESVHLLPDEWRRRRVLPRYLLADVHDAANFGTLLAATVGGDVIGAAAWIPPEAYPVSLARQARQALDLAPALPWGWHALSEARRGRTANRAHHRVHPPHFYLRALGVTPAGQAQGVGTALVSPVLALADERRVGCFLQTVAIENVSWYQRFGFEVAATYRPTDSWPPVWTMWRSPELS